jgi:hypothetical protein
MACVRAHSTVRVVDMWELAASSGSGSGSDCASGERSRHRPADRRGLCCAPGAAARGACVGCAAPAALSLCGCVPVVPLTCGVCLVCVVCCGRRPCRHQCLVRERLGRCVCAGSHDDTGRCAATVAPARRWNPPVPVPGAERARVRQRVPLLHCQQHKRSCLRAAPAMVPASQRPHACGSTLQPRGRCRCVREARVFRGLRGLPGVCLCCLDRVGRVIRRCHSPDSVTSSCVVTEVHPFTTLACVRACVGVWQVQQPASCIPQVCMCPCCTLIQRACRSADNGAAVSYRPRHSPSTAVTRACPSTV